MEVSEAWTAYKLDGGDASRNRLIEHYLPWVRRQAAAIAATLPRGAAITADELAQEGVFGLIRALARFDVDRGVKFETYATLPIRGAMLDWLRSIDHVPRLERQRAKQDGRVVRELGSLDAIRIFDDGGIPHPLADLLPDRRQAVAPFPAFDTYREVCRGLSKTERLLILLYYREQLTMRQIGESLGLCESRISQMHADILNRLRERFDPRRPPATNEATPLGRGGGVTVNGETTDVFALLKATKLPTVRKRIDDLEAELRALRVLEEAIQARDGGTSETSPVRRTGAGTGTPTEAKRPRGQLRRRITQHIAKHGPCRLADLCLATKAAGQRISTVLSRGPFVRVADGLWTLDESK